MARAAVYAYGMNPGDPVIWRRPGGGEVSARIIERRAHHTFLIAYDDAAGKERQELVPRERLSMAASSKSR